jgi:hypothetical protein
MRQLKKGSTDKSVILRIIDSTDGTPENSVVYNTSGIDLWYRREGATKTSITEVTLAALDTAHTDGGFLFIGDGYYRLDLPDAAWATGATHVMIGGTVTGMIVIGQEVQLVSFDPDDAVRFGLTSLPNAAADAAGGLAISDAGGLDLDAKLANTNEVTAARMGALTDWINGGRRAPSRQSWRRYRNRTRQFRGTLRHLRQFSPRSMPLSIRQYREARRRTRSMSVSLPWTDCSLARWPQERITRSPGTHSHG